MYFSKDLQLIKYHLGKYFRTTLISIIRLDKSKSLCLKKCFLHNVDKLS